MPDKVRKSTREQSVEILIVLCLLQVITGIEVDQTGMVDVQPGNFDIKEDYISSGNLISHFVLKDG